MTTGSVTHTQLLLKGRIIFGTTMTGEYSKNLEQLLKKINISPLGKFVKEGEQVVLEVDSGSVVLSKENGIITARDMSSSSHDYVFSIK